MQSIFVNATSHLQHCSAKLLGYYIVIQAKSMLIDRSTVPTTGLLILFFLVKQSK